MENTHRVLGYVLFIIVANEIILVYQSIEYPHFNTD